jgi:hypothetical protein
VSHLRHPEVGDLDLFRDKLAVTGTDGQLLVIYHARAGSESARSLALPGSMVASAPGDLHTGTPTRTGAED